MSLTITSLDEHFRYASDAIIVITVVAHIPLGALIFMDKLHARLIFNPTPLSLAQYTTWQINHRLNRRE